MGNGFKRFTGLTPLSLKNLNDQLEQLWLKVMGGIRLKDLDSKTQSIINSKLDEEEVQSIIRQSQDEIVLAVGSGGGDNLIHNGDFAFEFDSWGGSGVISGDFAKINGGSLLQTGIKVESGHKYSFGVEGFGTSGAVISVFGQYVTDAPNAQSVLLAKIDAEESSVSKRERGEFGVPAGIVTCCLKIESLGEYYVRRVFIREGEKVIEYTSNPNELIGSGISIREGNVDISTQRFNLEILDENGKVKSVMSADGNGFDVLQCNSVSVRGRDVAASSLAEIYVNSDTGNDSNDGLSTYTPFKTIGRALKVLALNLYDTNIIHLSGGTYFEDMDFCYGGVGSIVIKGESATLYGCIRIKGSAYTVYIQGLKVYSDTDYGIYGDGGSGYAEITNCLVDCNRVAGSNGIYLYNGFRMYVSACEVDNCDCGIRCVRGSYLNLVGSSGRNNNTGVFVDDMATINVYGTVPNGSIISKEGDSGIITGTMFGAKVGPDYQSPRDKIKKVTFLPTKKFSYIGGSAVSGVLEQGQNKAAVLGFNCSNIRSTLSGKTIKSVKLYVGRRNDDENTQIGVLRLFSHNISAETEQFSYTKSYGNVCEIKRGENIGFDLPVEILRGFINSQTKGVLFYDDSGETKYAFSLKCANDSPVLEVQYV